MESKPSTLSEFGFRWHTDKGTLHSYLDVYEELLGPLRTEPISLLEIGVAAGSSMGMWLEWMPRAQVYGVDTSLPPGFVHERLRLFEFDQCDEQQLFRMRELRFDVIIDDGSHLSRDQLLTCHALWWCLKPGGFYFVEDIPAPDRLHYWEMMPGYRSWVFQKDGRVDDTLVMLRKPK